MRLLECLLVENDCYKKFHNDHIEPTRILVHSTDKAGAVLRRFVQPASGQSYGLKDGDIAVTATRMTEILGKNPNGNSWNRPYVDACVHAFLGKCADGSYAVCKTLEYTQPCWGGAFGANGSFDGRKIVNGQRVAGGTLAVQFEMIEDGSNPSKEHCSALYELAVEFSAYLCRLYPTINPDWIVSHKEAHDMGYASNHGDPENYWKRCGMPYTMSGFRADVKREIKRQEELGMTEEELEQFVTRLIDEKFPEKWNEQYQKKMKSLSDNDCGKWSKEARDWAIDKGIISGVGQLPDGTTNYAWQSPLTREQFIQIEYRQALEDGEVNEDD